MALPERLARARLLARGLVALVALMLAVAACGSGVPASVAPVTPVPPGVVALDAKEYSFAPASLTATAGSVTFAVRNAGNEAHEFEVAQGDEPLAKIESFNAGTTGQVTVTLAAGEYTFACRLNGHDQLGMKGALTVGG